MTRELKYVPVSELADTDMQRLSWAVNLPSYAPAENIGVNIKRLGTLARLGGFSNLHISSYSGDTTVITPDIDSIGPDGSATATKSTTATKAKTHDSHLDDEHSLRLLSGYDEYFWKSGTVRLNTSEIDNRVGEKGNVREPKSWARELDIALSGGVRAVTRKNLIDTVSPSNKKLLPAVVAASLVIGTITGERLSSYGSFIEFELKSIGLYQFVFEPLISTALGFRLSERRWSLVPGVQLDRVLAVSGISRALPLVKALDS